MDLKHAKMIWTQVHFGGEPGSNRMHVKTLPGHFKQTRTTENQRGPFSDGGMKRWGGNLRERRNSLKRNMSLCDIPYESCLHKTGIFEAFIKHSPDPCSNELGSSMLDCDFLFLSRSGTCPRWMTSRCINHIKEMWMNCMWWTGTCWR